MSPDMSAAHANTVSNRRPVYHAAPGRVEGTWMVIVQLGPDDFGRGVINELPNLQAAEMEADRLNGEIKRLNEIA